MIESVNRMYGGEWDGKAIMVYGLKSCGYMDINRAFAEKGVTSYSYALGLDDQYVLRSKSQGIVQIRSEHASALRSSLLRLCKAAITNIIFLNYVLLENQKSIVPIIFCMEKEGVRDCLTIETITDKQQRKKVVTASEIRRAFKHCTDPALYDKIKEVAKKTFRFVRVELDNVDQDPYTLNPIPAPWDDPSFEPRFADRIKDRQRFGVSNWRGQLNELVTEYDLTKIY